MVPGPQPRRCRVGERVAARSVEVQSLDFRAPRRRQHTKSSAGLLRRVSVTAVTMAASMALAGCGLLPSPHSAWKVDVLNADRPMIVSITTDAAAWSWLVPANAEMVLPAERQAPTEGRIDLIDPGGGCTVYDSAALPTGSFTITPRKISEDPLAFSIAITAGASIQAPANTDYFGGCSG